MWEPWECPRRKKIIEPRLFQYTNTWKTSCIFTTRLSCERKNEAEQRAPPHTKTIILLSFVDLAIPIESCDDWHLTASWLVFYNRIRKDYYAELHSATCPTICKWRDFGQRSRVGGENINKWLAVISSCDKPDRDVTWLLNKTITSLFAINHSWHPLHYVLVKYVHRGHSQNSRLVVVHGNLSPVRRDRPLSASYRRESIATNCEAITAIHAEGAVAWFTRMLRTCSKDNLHNCTGIGAIYLYRQLKQTIGDKNGINTTGKPCRTVSVNYCRAR